MTPMQKLRSQSGSWVWRDGKVLARAHPGGFDLLYLAIMLNKVKLDSYLSGSFSVALNNFVWLSWRVGLASIVIA